MADGSKTLQESGARPDFQRRVAWILLFIVDAGFIAWGGAAAALLDHLPGPGGKPIMVAGYEGYSRLAWADLVHTSPMAARYMNVLYRTYGMYNVAFGVVAVAIILTAFRRGDRWAWWALLAGNTITLVSAITYDRLVNAIGPFEMSEYLGLALVYLALALASPWGAPGRLTSAREPALASGRGR